MKTKVESVPIIPKTVLRGMGVYHGKRGSGISVEVKVKSGPVTTLNVTQTKNGKLKFIISEAEATDGPIMCIGNTQTPVNSPLIRTRIWISGLRKLPHITVPSL